MFLFLLVADDVEDYRAYVLLGEASQLRSDLGIASDQVWTIRLVGQKRQKPIAVLVKLTVLPELIKAPFPDGIPFFDADKC